MLARRQLRAGKPEEAERTIHEAPVRAWERPAMEREFQGLSAPRAVGSVDP